VRCQTVESPVRNIANLREADDQQEGGVGTPSRTCLGLSLIGKSRADRKPRANNSLVGSENGA